MILAARTQHEFRYSERYDHDSKSDAESYADTSHPPGPIVSTAAFVGAFSEQRPLSPRDPCTDHCDYQRDHTDYVQYVNVSGGTGMLRQRIAEPFVEYPCYWPG